MSQDTSAALCTQAQRDYRSLFIFQTPWRKSKQRERGKTNDLMSGTVLCTCVLNHFSYPLLTRNNNAKTTNLRGLVLFSLSGWSAVTFMRWTWRSLSDHRSCRSENKNTSVKLPRRWSNYVIWFVLHIRVEAWVAQVISYDGIEEGNSNTGCSVWIVGRNGRMEM